MVNLNSLHHHRVGVSPLPFYFFIFYFLGALGLKIVESKPDVKTPNAESQEMP